MSASTVSRIVLVAEDNAISREVLLHQLRLLDCEAVACEDGSLAAQAWRQGRFDLLLTDLQMPVLDGFGLAAVIRSEERSARMPIVALSANSSTEETQRCLEGGIDDCLAKPATLVALRATIEKWLTPPREVAAPSCEGTRR